MVALALDHATPYTPWPPAKSFGPPPTSAGSSATATSSTPPSSPAAPPSSTKANPSAPPTPGHSGASSSSTRSAKTLFTAPTAIRAIRKQDPDAKPPRRLRHPPASAPFSSPANAPTPTPFTGPNAPSPNSRHRPLVANRDRLVHRRQPARPRASPHQGRLPHRPHARLRTSPSSMPTATPSPPGDHGHHRHQAPPPPRRPPHPVERRPAFPTRAYLAGLPRLLRRPPTPGSWTRTATCSSWAAPTTSSTSPAIASAPAPSKRSSRFIQAVAECAVIGIPDSLKGEIPCAFVILKDGNTRPHPDLAAEVVRLVRDTIGPVAAFHQVLIVDRLPKTRSGKILRATMKRIVQHEPYTPPATIEDPAALDEIARATQHLLGTPA